MYWLRPRFLTRQFHRPVMLSGSGWRWWVMDESARQAVRTLDRYLWNKDAEGVTLLTEKAAKLRSTYRLALSEPSGTSLYFAKQVAQVPRKRLGGLLGSDNVLLGFNHGTAELAYNLALDERTTHGVKTFAFGEYFQCGLPARQVLLQEYLTEWQPFEVVWPRANYDAKLRQALLWKLTDMLVAFRDAGIHHLDLHPGNVMVSPDPEAPLRAIDCGKMSAQADPALSAALHLGVFLHELNNKYAAASPLLEVGPQRAQNLLRHIVGNEDGFATAEQLLPLLLRYSTKRPFSRRRLVQHRHRTLNLQTLEKNLQKLNRPPYPVEVSKSLSVAMEHDI